MRRQVVRAALAVAVLVTLAACGDDDAGSDATATSTTGRNGAAADREGFCSGYIKFTAGDPSPEQIRELVASAPEEGREALERIARAFEEEDDDFFQSDAYSESYGTIGRVAADECADSTMDVTATDYAFDGIPSQVEPGIIGVNFTNEGEEYHEMLVFRRNDDVSQSFDDIFGLGEEESQALLSEQGGTFAVPGGEAPGLLRFDEPGDYVAVCFIPVGSTLESEEASGPPHFTRGMKTEFTVG